MPKLGKASRIGPNAVGNEQLKHAKQLALAQQYPGRERSMPSAKVFELETIKRSN
jgi:hypothetical protein